MRGKKGESGRGGERGFKTRRYGMFGILINWVYECFILFYFVFVWLIGPGSMIVDSYVWLLVFSFSFF